jgi:bleomycin hydrolase
MIIAGCGRKQPALRTVGERFTNDVVLKTTPVKDQGHSDLCWAYAMLATMETEHLMQGDSVNLSADYVARKFIEEQASRLFITRRGTVSLRGMAPMLIHLIGIYGLDHYDAFHADSTTDYHVVCRKVQEMAKGGLSLRQFDNRLSALLDRDIHTCIPRVYMLGAVYTPLEFAHSVCRDNEYQAFTSFTHHPFNEWMVIEAPYKWRPRQSYNVPLDELMSIIDEALDNGYPVCWGGDVSGNGFDRHGVAREANMPTQEQRQQRFDSWDATYDHVMLIYGKAVDQEGQEYYMVKNSWGASGRYDGIWYMQKNYIAFNTTYIFINKHAVAKDY